MELELENTITKSSLKIHKIDKRKFKFEDCKQV